MTSNYKLTLVLNQLTQIECLSLNMKYKRYITQ
ncbi:hypothetical protein CoNPh17_CDS0049 [Staphylococcus phage S-CoN_Ph17]|nr:hypothetical protein CoNPh17_CDS0049 [Staphylococcus phage S-CoN_Ph17]